MWLMICLLCSGVFVVWFIRAWTNQAGGRCKRIGWPTEERQKDRQAGSRTHRLGDIRAQYNTVDRASHRWNRWSPCVRAAYIPKSKQSHARAHRRTQTYTEADRGRRRQIEADRDKQRQTGRHADMQKRRLADSCTCAWLHSCTPAQMHTCPPAHVRTGIMQYKHI